MGYLHGLLLHGYTLITLEVQQGKVWDCVALSSHLHNGLCHSGHTHRSFHHADSTKKFQVVKKRKKKHPCVIAFFTNTHWARQNKQQKKKKIVFQCPQWFSTGAKILSQASKAGNGKKKKCIYTWKSVWDDEGSRANRDVLTSWVSIWKYPWAAGRHLTVNGCHHTGRGLDHHEPTNKPVLWEDQWHF